MADGLATINIDQLNHAVTSAVNLARLADLSSSVSRLATTSASTTSTPSSTTTTVKSAKVKAGATSESSAITTASSDNHVFIKPSSAGVPRRKSEGSRTLPSLVQNVTKTPAQDVASDEMTPSVGTPRIVLNQPQVLQAGTITFKVPQLTPLPSPEALTSQATAIQSTDNWSFGPSTTNTASLSLCKKHPLGTTCHDVQMPVVQSLPPGSQIVNSFIPQTGGEFMTAVKTLKLVRLPMKNHHQLIQSLTVVPTQSVPEEALVTDKPPSQGSHNPQTVTIMPTSSDASAIPPFVTSSPTITNCPPDLLAAATQATVPHLVTQYPLNKPGSPQPPATSLITYRRKRKKLASIQPATMPSVLVNARPTGAAVPSVMVTTATGKPVAEVVMVQTTGTSASPISVRSATESGTPLEEVSHVIVAPYITNSIDDESLETTVVGAVSHQELLDDSNSKEPDMNEALPFKGKFCILCNRVIANQKCPIHDLTESHMIDSPILTYARATLPPGLFINSQSSKLIGMVETLVAIEARTRFGPLIGAMKSNPITTKQSQLIWKVMTSPTEWQILDCSDEALSNWMRFVRPASCADEQNLTAFQEDEHIYFMASKDIKPQTELRYWYAGDYAKFIGKFKERFMCSVCGEKSFTSLDEVQEHIRSLHRDTTFCSLHHDTFHSLHHDTSIRSLQHDTSKLKYACKLCSRAFASSSKRKTHMMSHTGEKPHVCRFCDKAFSDQSNLRMHLIIHSDIRRFKCTICHRAFKQKAHLTSHMMTHTGEKSMKCEYCGKMFARRSDMRQHELQHTKRCVYWCEKPGCSKNFYKLSNLKKHLKIHAGVRDFVCPECQKTFTSAYHLKRHMTNNTTHSPLTQEAPSDPE